MRTLAYVSLLSVLFLSSAAEGQPLVAIDANPAATTASTDSDKRQWAGYAKQAGATFTYYAPHWAALEPAPGVYDFRDLDLQMSIARDNGWLVALNIRVVDTNSRSMPSDLAGLPFSSSSVTGRLKKLIQKLGPRARSVRWIEVGNEVNAYFGSHPTEIGAYRKMLDAVRPTLRQQWPNVPMSVNMTWTAAAEMSKYSNILAVCDFVSFTYYPLNSDLTVRPTSAVPGDLAIMLWAAGGKQLLLQEVGYPSSPLLGSSESAQAEFVSAIFKNLQSRGASIIGANFVWMSDIPSSVVDDLANYYGLAWNENFKAYLGTLGYFDTSGREKPAWEAFWRGAWSSRQ